MNDNACVQLSHVLKPTIVGFLKYGGYLYANCFQWNDSKGSANLQPRKTVRLVQAAVLYSWLYLAIQVFLTANAKVPNSDKLLGYVLISGVAVNFILRSDLDPDVLSLQPFHALVSVTPGRHVAKGLYTK